MMDRFDVAICRAKTLGANEAKSTPKGWVAAGSQTHYLQHIAQFFLGAYELVHRIFFSSFFFFLQAICSFKQIFIFVMVDGFLLRTKKYFCSCRLFFVFFSHPI